MAIFDHFSTSIRVEYARARAKPMKLNLRARAAREPMKQSGERSERQSREAAKRTTTTRAAQPQSVEAAKRRSAPQQRAAAKLQAVRSRETASRRAAKPLSEAPSAQREVLSESPEGANTSLAGWPTRRPLNTYIYIYISSISSWEEGEEGPAARCEAERAQSKESSSQAEAAGGGGGGSSSSSSSSSEAASGR